MNLEQKMKQELCRELVIPDAVDEKLNEAYRQILSRRPQKERTVKQNTEQISAEQTNTAHTRQGKRRMAAWAAAAAAAAAPFPILPNLFILSFLLLCIRISLPLISGARACFKI